MRDQLAFLKKFLEGFDFVKMTPDNKVIRRYKISPAPVARGEKPQPAPTVRALVEAGRQYALYFRGGVAADLTLELPPGDYRAEWLNPQTGRIEKVNNIRHPGGDCPLKSPPYVEDQALRITLTNLGQRVR